MATKKNVIIIDTMTEIMNQSFLRAEGSPTFDEWMDWGKELNNLVSDINKLGFESIMVYGDPGTGKSCGIRTLDPDKVIWFNADQKPPTWTGGKKDYGTHINPTPKRHIPVTSYKQITDVLNGAIKAGAFEEERYAFLLGHVEVYKRAGNERERLHTLGKMNNKVSVERGFTTVMKSAVEIGEDGKPNYILETQNNGFNTVRSMMDLFDLKIPNDYQLIIDKMKEENL